MTIKEIAKIAGVSIGTVDRVLHNRGGVNPETEQKIQMIIKAANYTPNSIGQNLSIKRKASQQKFGCIIPGDGLFYSDMIDSIKLEKKKLGELGITVDISCYTPGSPESLLECLAHMESDGMTGIAIVPIANNDVMEKIHTMVDNGIRFVTCDFDIPNARRIAYVGHDHFRCGETAATVVNLMSQSGSILGVVSGNRTLQNHPERLEGFYKKMNTYYHDIKSLPPAYCADDNASRFHTVSKLLAENPKIDILYLDMVGYNGVCQAITACGRPIKVVCTDRPKYVQSYLESGLMSIAFVTPMPTFQMPMALDILFNSLVLDRDPIEECNYSNIEITVADNAH